MDRLIAGIDPDLVNYPVTPHGWHSGMEEAREEVENFFGQEGDQLGERILQNQVGVLAAEDTESDLVAFDEAVGALEEVCTFPPSAQGLKANVRLNQGDYP